MYIHACYSIEGFVNGSPEPSPSPSEPPADPPVASNVVVVGEVVVGDSLAVTYDYTGDAPESGTTFKWYRANDGAGAGAVEIGGATSHTYELQVADIGKFVACGVTPSDGTLQGDEVISAYVGPAEQYPLIAFMDTVNKNLRTLEFNGSDWAQVGDALNIANASSGGLAALTAAQIAYANASTTGLEAYSWDGTDWTKTGNTLNITGVQFSATVAALNSSTVAFADAGNDNLRRFSWDGTDFTALGSPTAIMSLLGPYVCQALSETRVVIGFINIGTNQQNIRVYDLISGTWTQVGNTLVIASTSSLALTALTSSRIAYVSEPGLRAYDFDGTNFSLVGNTLSLGTLGTVGIDSLSSTRVVFADAVNDEVRTYQFDGTDWSQVGNSFAVSSMGGPMMACLTYL